METEGNRRRVDTSSTLERDAIGIERRGFFGAVRVTWRIVKARHVNFWTQQRVGRGLVPEVAVGVIEHPVFGDQSPVVVAGSGRPGWALPVSGLPHSIGAEVEFARLGVRPVLGEVVPGKCDAMVAPGD